MNGRDFEHFLGTAEGEQERANKRQELETIANANPYINEDGSSKGRFPNLTRSAKNAIGYQLINAVSPIYFDTKEQLEKDKFAALTQQITDHISELVTISQEKQKEFNAGACLALNSKQDLPNRHGVKKEAFTTEYKYDEATNTCIASRIKWTRDGPGIAYNWNEDSRTDTSIQMPSIHKYDVKDGALSDATAKKDAETAAKRLKNGGVGFDD